MRLRTAHKRARRKSQGRIIPRADLRRFVLANKYAASKDCDYQWRQNWYRLKDGILAVYGRDRGLCLQTWYSHAYDSYGDYDGVNDAACHEHLLQRKALRGRIFHQPTGHFYYQNCLNGYYKLTVGFRKLAATAVEKITGKKRDQKIQVNAEAAQSAAQSLEQRYRWTCDFRPAKEVLRVMTGSDDDDYEYLRHLETAERLAKAAARAEQQMQCVWCLAVKLGKEMKTYEQREYCFSCYDRVMADIPF